MTASNSNPIQQPTDRAAALPRRRLWISLGVVLSFLFAAYLATEIWLGSNDPNIQFSRAGR